MYDKYNPENLEKLRKEKKMTIIQLANAIKDEEGNSLPFSTMQQYCSGRRKPRHNMAKRIANYFGVDEAYILGIQDFPTTKTLMDGKEMRLTPTEVNIIRGYRKASEAVKRAVEVLFEA